MFNGFVVCLDVSPYSGKDWSDASKRRKVTTLAASPFLDLPYVRVGDVVLDCNRNSKRNQKNWRQDSGWRALYNSERIASSLFRSSLSSTTSPSKLNLHLNMLYVSHVHSASSSIQSLILDSFLPSNHESIQAEAIPCLCQVNHDSLQFLSLNQLQLQPITSLKLNSRILSISSVPSNPSTSTSTPGQDLLILTDHHNPRLIRVRAKASTSNQSWTFETISSFRIEHLARPPAETALQLSVDPLLNPRVAISHSHSGLLNVLPLKQSSSSRISPFSLRWVTQL